MKSYIRITKENIPKVCKLLRADVNLIRWENSKVIIIRDGELTFEIGDYIIFINGYPILTCSEEIFERVKEGTPGVLVEW